MESDFTLKSFRRTYGMYMVVGLAAIPAGIIYAILAVNGFERWWTDVLVLIVGVLTAHAAWRSLTRRMHPTGTAARSATDSVTYAPGLRRG